MEPGLHNTAWTVPRTGVIIGGSGLIGGVISLYFKQNTPDRILIFAPNSKQLNIRNAIDIKTYLRRRRPDFVINAAMAALDSRPQLTFETNYIGAINLARVCCAMRIPYIHISSAATLPGGEDLTEEECLPFYPSLAPYPKSKIMAEQTLRVMRERYGLDYTIIRLAIVYGKYDCKIQGFHRLLFTIASEAMPLIVTRKGVCHSYSNARKLPYFIDHILEHRQEFSGETYHFVDTEPVELATLIQTLRARLQVKRPYNVFLPYKGVRLGKFFVEKLASLLLWLGVTVKLPPEMIFLENFYKTQTLSNKKLRDSSFVDPFPGETVYSFLPELVDHYLTTWKELNMLSADDDECFGYEDLELDFLSFPQYLLDTMHKDSIAPFFDVLEEDHSYSGDTILNY